MRTCCTALAGLLLVLGAGGCRRHERPQTTASAPSTAASIARTVPTALGSSAPLVEGCPAEMARVERFCIDRYEAHLVTRTDDGRETVHPPYERPAERVRYLARSRPGIMPQAYVNRHEARAACENANKRLCTLVEWHAACAGPRRFTYPYGNTLDREACNGAKPHLLAKLFGNDPRRWNYDEHFNSPLLDREPGYLARTGQYPRCVSAYGVYDLVGNLHEWVSDRVDAALPAKIELIEDLRGRIDRNLGHGIFMGGFYSTTSEHGPGCRFVTIGHEPSYHDYSTGLRCCADASPSLPG